LAARLGEHRLVSVAASQVAATELLRGRYWRALHWADHAAGRGAGNPVMASRVGTIRGTAMVDTGHVGEGMEELEKAVTGADRRTAAFALCTLGKAHLLRGELDAAEDVLTRAGELARVHWLALLPWPTALRAEAVLRRGRVDRAQELLAQAHALARRFEHSPGWDSAAARGLGLVAAARGADDRAVIWLEQAYRRCARGGLTYRWLRCQALESLCELAVAGGSPAAPMWLAELDHSAGRWGMHGFVARAGEFRARLGGRAAGSVGECGAEAADHRFGGHRWIGQDDAVPGSVAMVGL
jgi:tetratricopeptide (TPR) repeat protein